MQRILGLKFWYVSVGGWLASSMSVAHLLYGWLQGRLAVALSGSWLAEFTPSLQVGAAMIAALPFALFLCKPVWRFIWWFPPSRRFFSSRVFPDLNGLWDVEISTNWQRIAALDAAARNAKAPRYDTRDFDSIPLAPPIRLKARIDQGWTGVSMTMWSEDPASRIERSHTTAIDLLRGPGGEAEIAYFYSQTNRAETIAGSDVDSFAGAAQLRASDDGQSMEGSFLTTRKWEAGLNTAGRVSFSRSKSKARKK